MKTQETFLRFTPIQEMIKFLKNLTQYPGASAILGIYKLALLYGAINNYLDKGGL
jgi:hypothetical protein